MANILNPGKSLLINEFIQSANGKLKLVMQEDGNLVLSVVSTGKPIWATGTDNKSGKIATMQEDGNLVVSTGDNKPLWGAGTDRHPGAFLVLHNNGNLDIHYGQEIIWTSKSKLD